MIQRACTLIGTYLLSTLLLTSVAFAEKRVALVIGNAAYQQSADLKNPRNDAEAIAAKLSQLGFHVLKGIDSDQNSFKSLVRSFIREMNDAELALFYYAGHGMQVGQRNYLLPVDAELMQESDLGFEAVELRFIMEQMERQELTNIVLLDACRDNPFTANLARNMGTRSSTIGRGLAPIEGGVGTFVGFATQPGNVALDGKRANSPFTAAILKHLDEPDLDISVLMRRVREDVIAETKGKQVPWNNSSLVGDSVVLNTSTAQVVAEQEPARGICVGTAEECSSFETPDAPVIKESVAALGSASVHIEPEQTATKQLQQAINPTTGNIALELSFWNTIKNSKNPALFKSYLTQYPEGTFAGLAQAMMTSLDSQSSPAQRATPPSEQTEIAPATTPQATPTTKRIPSPVLTQPAVPAARPQKKQKVATIDPNAATGELQIEQPDPAARNYSISHEMQSELRRLGCIRARPDGIWGPKSRGALKRYGKYAGLSLPSLEPTDELLDGMRLQKNRVCPIQCGARYLLKGGKCVRKTCPRNKVLTRKGTCIAKAAKRTVTKKRRRRQPEIVEEEIIEPRRQRPRNNRNKMFDDEIGNCPRCGSM